MRVTPAALIGSTSTIRSTRCSRIPWMGKSVSIVRANSAQHFGELPFCLRDRRTQTREIRLSVQPDVRHGVPTPRLATLAVKGTSKIPRFGMGIWEICSLGSGWLLRLSHTCHQGTGTTRLLYLS